jgi:hypothetical protein
MGNFEIAASKPMACWFFAGASPCLQHLKNGTCKRRAGPVLRRELETNFDEFSACSDAEAVFGGVVRVSVIVAPRDILLMIQMADDRQRDQNDGYADDESTSYQLFHFYFIPS